jgi:hypothetical protein
LDRVAVELNGGLRGALGWKIRHEALVEFLSVGFVDVTT